MALVLAEPRPLQHTSSVLGRVQVPRVPRQEKSSPEMLGSVEYQRRNDERKLFAKQALGITGDLVSSNKLCRLFSFRPHAHGCNRKHLGPCFHFQRIKRSKGGIQCR